MNIISKALVMALLLTGCVVGTQKNNTFVYS